MLRYRIARHPKGHYIVLPALTWIVPVEDTYAIRSAAQETADWFNSLEFSQQPARGSLVGRCASEGRYRGRPGSWRCNSFA